MNTGQKIIPRSCKDPEGEEPPPGRGVPPTSVTPLDRAVAGDDTGEEGRGKKRWVLFVWACHDE